MAGMAGADSISVLVMAVERLAESQLDTNKKVDKLIESMGKQEVILEKLSNIEKAHIDSVKRIYHVIDDVKERVVAIEHKQINGGCQSFRTFQSSHDNELKHNLDKIAIFEKFMKDTKDKPIKMMDKVWMALLGALGAGIGGWLLIKLGVGK